MKKIILLFTLVLLLLSGCSNMQMGFEEDSPFYQGGATLSLYLEPNSAEKTPYKVYINGEDTEVTLAPNIKTRFGLVEGDTEIAVVHAKERTSLHIFLNSSNEYYLKLGVGAGGEMSLRQVPKSALPQDAKSSELYVDEQKAKESAEAETKAILTDYGEETLFEMDKNVTEKTKTPKNGDTIFYYELDDGE